MSTQKPPDVVYTRDRSSGRVHLQYRGTSGKLHPFEGCNLDDAGEAEEIDATEAERVRLFDPGKLCGNDFPNLDEPITA